MQLDEATALARDFARKIRAIKAAHGDVAWYPYDSFGNFEHFNSFTGAGRDLFRYIGTGSKVADIGAADGDTSFFFESLGADVTIIDNPPTNANSGLAILKLRSLLKSKAKVQFIDLEWTPWIPGYYDIAVFLGIMYHLRNPGLALNTLAHSTGRLLLSTMVFFRLEDGSDVQHQQLAYFIDRGEINNDSTNYWLFTPKALRVFLRRSGWLVRDEFVVGDRGASPAKGDCRMFCFCERVDTWKDLRLSCDF